MARLRILSNDDFDKLYKIPKLNDEERQFIFELDEIDKNYLNTINSIPVKGVEWKNTQKCRFIFLSPPILVF